MAVAVMTRASELAPADSSARTHSVRIELHFTEEDYELALLDAEESSMPLQAHMQLKVAAVMGDEAAFASLVDRLQDRLDAILSR